MKQFVHQPVIKIPGLEKLYTYHKLPSLFEQIWRLKSEAILSNII